MKKKKKNIVRYQEEQILTKSKTNWKKFDELSDKQIDTSEIPELDKEWFKNAKIVMPEKKKAISLRVDKDVLEWFKSKSKGKGYQTFMNAVLKAFVEAQKKNT
ncbi:hypothetical protein BMS3Abin03_01170 [bacterium BMS3Abin03]|nr:hypothetical protein BMS3Abin03_01170 [bacterium BMS3Abin03]